MQLEIELFAFDPFADRIWGLRYNVTSYDAWYVALAEALNLPLATLDKPLSRAKGPKCKFLTPRRT
jgi:predicted nucleic acid-binding protein